MNTKQFTAILIIAAMPLASVFAESAKAQAAAASEQAATPEQIARAKAQRAKQAREEMLARVYNMRMRIAQERAAEENQARANVRLATQSGYKHIDAPTVSGLRSQTNTQLARFEQMFRCLDVDVEGNNGNTVVICGDNSGDISGQNISADRDIVTYQGGQQ